MQMSQFRFAMIVVCLFTSQLSQSRAATLNCKQACGEFGSGFACSSTQNEFHASIPLEDTQSGLSGKIDRKWTIRFGANRKVEQQAVGVYVNVTEDYIADISLYAYDGKTGYIAESADTGFLANTIYYNIGRALNEDERKVMGALLGRRGGTIRFHDGKDFSILCEIKR